MANNRSAEIARPRGLGEFAEKVGQHDGLIPLDGVTRALNGNDGRPR